MAGSRRNNNVLDSFSASWKLITYAVGICASLFVAGFFVGGKYEETSGKLKETERVLDCNEKLEDERTKVANLRDELNRKTMEQLEAVANTIKQKKNGK